MGISSELKEKIVFLAQKYETKDFLEKILQNLCTDINPLEIKKL